MTKYKYPYLEVNGALIPGRSSDNHAREIFFLEKGSGYFRGNTIATMKRIKLDHYVPMVDQWAHSSELAKTFQREVPIVVLHGMVQEVHPWWNPPGEPEGAETAEIAAHVGLKAVAAYSMGMA